MEWLLRVMSLEWFLSKPAGKMPTKQLSEKKDTSVASPQDDDAMLAANTNVAPDPGLTQALEVMTANIATMMDGKLEKILHDITTNISQSLKEVTDCVGEAEQRILVVENVSTDAGQRLLALEKQRGSWPGMKITHL